MSKEISTEDQLRSVTTLLGALLLMIDEPVHIAKDILREGIPDNSNIAIIDSVDDDEYVLYVEELDA